MPVNHLRAWKCTPRLDSGTSFDLNLLKAITFDPAIRFSGIIYSWKALLDSKADIEEDMGSKTLGMGCPGLNFSQGNTSPHPNLARGSCFWQT